MKNRYLFIILLIILIIPSFWFLAKPGFIVTDDGNWMIIRFSAFYQALRDGQFPVRFLPRLNFDYGYPVANFLYPGFMYLAVPFKVIGLSFVESIKILIGLCMIGSGVFIYLWLSKLFDPVSSFFASLYYVYAPYHIYDMAKRGSVGELLSLAVFPFLMWQVERQSVLLSSLGLALLIISHNTLAILFISILIIYGAISIYVAKKRREAFDFYKQVIIFGFGISAFFWIPATLELGNTAFSKTKISNFSEYFADYNLIGITTFIIFIGTVLTFALKSSLVKKHRITIMMFVIGSISIFMASPISEIIWKYLPVGFVQFPFRLLSITIIAGAFLLAFCLSQIDLKLRIAAGILLISATVFLSKDYLLPRDYNNLPDTFYSTNEASTTVLDEYMPLWVDTKPVAHPENKIELIQGEGKIQNINMNSKNISFDFVSESPAVVRVNTIYYPGWRVYSDGLQKAIFYDNSKGVMDVKLIGHNQRVALVFGETSLRIISDIISVISIIILFILVSYKPVLAKLKK